MKMLDWLSKIRKLWGGSKPRPPSVVVETTEWYPRLYDTRLEPRQVLDGTPLVQLNPGGQLTVGAGSAANDGHADVFQVAKVEKDGASYLEVSVNDQTAFSARFSEIQQITLLGSRDADFLKIDPNALPAGGLAFQDDSRPGDAADSLVIQPFQSAGAYSGTSASGSSTSNSSAAGGTSPSATSTDNSSASLVSPYAQVTAHLGTQSGSWQATRDDGSVARIDLEGLEYVDDRTTSASRVLLIDDGVSGLVVDSGLTADGRMAWHSDAGVSYDFTAPFGSLTIAAANSSFGADGTGSGIGSGIGGASGNASGHHGDDLPPDTSVDHWRIESTDLLASTHLTIQTGASDTLAIDGLVTNAAGEIELVAHDIVVAGRIEAIGGHVSLRASDDVTVTGSISVARLELSPDSATGGRIDVLAATIDLKLGSVLDARGGVRGGSIVVIADEALQVFGQIDARGGIVSPTDPLASGGFVETSSFGALVLESSPLIGAGGTWLIDPTNITISSAATNNVGTTGANPITYTGTTSPANLSVSTVRTQLLAGVQVIVQTGNTGTEAGDITLSAELDFDGVTTGELVLRAHRNIVINNRIYDSNLATPTDKLKLTLVADTAAADAGSISINENIDTRGGLFTSSGFNFSLASGKSLSTLGGNVVLTHNGAVTLDGTMSAAGGAGTGGVQIDGASGITVNASLSGGSGLTRLAVPSTSFVNLNANVTTGGGSVQITGPTKIQSGVTIDTTNAGGVATGANVSFSSTVNSSTSTPQSLTITAGTGGTVTMTGAVGATNPLSSLQVTAGNVTLGASVATTGAIALTSGASGLIQLSGNIVTAGQTVTLTGPVQLAADVSIDTTNAGGAAAGAAISFSSTVNSSSATARALTIAAGTSGAVTMTGAIGATNSLSTLTATANSLTLGTSLKTTGAISLTADTIALPTTADTVTGGSITIQTQTASRRLDIVAAETGSNLELTPAEIAALKDGFSSITLGRADGTGGISVATPVTFKDPVTLRSPNGGTINVAGQITGAGNSSVTLTSGASGLIQLSSNIVTAGQAVALTGPVLLAADVSIDTTNSGSATSGAAISFSSTVDSSSATARSLQLLGGTGGAVTMTGAVGATNPLSSLQVTASSLTLGASLATTGAITLTADRLALPTTVDSVSGGSITIQTQTASRRLDIVASEIGSNLELTPAEIAALKNGFSSITLGRSNGTGGINVGTSAIFNDPVTLRSPNGGTIDIAAGITGVGDASVTITSGGTGDIHLSKSIVTDGQAISLAGPIRLVDNSKLDTTNNGATAAGADVDLLGAIDAAASGAVGLTVRAGTSGDIQLTGIVGGGSSPLSPPTALDLVGHDITLSAAATVAGPVTIAAANNVSLSGDVTARDSALSISSASGTATIGANVALSTVGATNATGANITLNGAWRGAAGTETLTLLTGTQGAIDVTAATLGTLADKIGAISATAGDTKSVKLGAIYSSGGLTARGGTVTDSVAIVVNGAVSISSRGTTGDATNLSLAAFDSRGNNVTLDSRLGITLTGGADTLESSTNGGTLTLRSSQATDALQFGGAAVTTWYMSDASLEAVGCGFDTIVFGADATVTAGVVDPSGKVTVSGAPQSYNADLVIWGNGTGSGIDILTSIDTLECGPEMHSITLNAKKLALVSNDITLNGDLSTYGGAVTASGDELTVSAGATRTIDTGATGGGPAPTTAGAIDLSGMVSIRGSAETAELSLKARGGTNGADVLLAGATTGSGGVSQLSLLEVSNWDASGARVVSLGPVNLASTATATSSVQINFGASSTSFVRINGAIDISSNVAAMSGGSFDASIARLIPYAANTELKIDSSATLTGGGGDFGGFVRFGSIVGTTIGASTEYFNGVDIDTRGDAGNGSLIFTSTGAGFPKIEVDGELSTAADHQAVILAGSIGMPSAGTLTIATNPGAVAQSTGGIDLTSAVIGSSVSLVLDTSGGATATDAGDIRLGDLGTSTTGVAGLSLDARGSTSAGLLVVDDQTTGSPATWYVYSPTGSPRTLDLTKFGGVELLDDFSILTPSGASPVTSVVFPTGAATLNGNGHRLTIDVRGGALGDGNVQLPAHVGGSGSAALASLAVYTGTGTIDLGDATTTGGVSVTVSPAIAGDELRLDGALTLFGDATMTVNSGSAVVGPVVLRNVDGDSTATPRDLTIDAGAGAVSIDRVGSAAPGASGIDAWTVTADTLHVTGTVNSQGAIDLRTSTSITLDDDVDSHGRDVLLQTNSLTLGGDLTSSTSGGVVTLRPATSSTSIGIGAAATGTLQLTQALLDKIGASFSRVDVGYSGAPQQSGNVVVDSGTPGIAVTISGNSLRVYGDAASAGITLNSALATTGAGNSLELFASSFGVSVAQTVTLSTQSGQLSVHGALRFNSGVTAALDTVTAGGAGGAVSIDGDVLGDGATGVALGVVAGSGSVTIGDATTDKVDSATSGQTFGGLDIVSHGVITINSSLDVTYAVIGDTATSVTFQSPVTLSGNGPGLDPAGSNYSLKVSGRDITFAAGASITVNAGGGGLWFAGDPSSHGTLGLGGGVVLDSSPGAGIYIDSNFNNLTLGQNISTQGGAVSLGLPVILTSNTSIVTNANGSAGADITFGGAVVSASGTQSLTLNAGTAGDITSTSSLGGTGGANNGELNGLTITSARDVSLATVRTVNGLSSSSSTFAASGPIDSRNAAVSIDALASFGTSVSLDDVDAHGQNLLVTAAANVVFSGGAASLVSTGGGGRFQLAGLTTATTLGLGDGATGALTISSASLDALGAGFTSGIEFGRTGQTGQLQFAGATQSYDENVKVWADGGAMIELSTSLDTVENGATGKSITLAGSAVSTIQLGKNLTTAGGDVVATGGTFYVVGIGTGGGAHRIDTGNAFAATSGGRIDLSGVTQIDGLSYSDGFNLRAPLLTLRTAGSQTAASLTLPNVIGNPSSGHGLNQLDLQTATPVTATTPNVADITLRNVRLVSLAGDAGARLLINSTSSLDGSVFVNGTIDLTGADNSAVSAAKSLFMPSSSTATLAVVMDGDFTARGIAGTPLGRYLDSVDINLDATSGGFVGTLRLDSGLPAGTLLAVDGAATGSPPSSTITIAGNVLLPATGPLTMTTNPTATRLASGSIDLRNAMLNGPGELTLNTSVGTSGGSGTPAAGFVYLGDAGTAALPLTQLTISTSNQAGGAAGAVRLGDSDPFSPTAIFISTGALDLTSATQVELLDDVDIHTQPNSSVGTAGDVLFDSSSSARLIGNLHSLTIETRGSGANRGDVVLPGTIGQNSGEELSQLVVDVGDGQITFGSPATIGGVDVLRTTGLVRFTGDVQLSTNSQWSTQGGDIDLSGATLGVATGATPSAPTLSLDTDANNTGAGGDVLASDIAGLGGLSIDTGSAVTGGLLRFGPDPIDDVTVSLAAPFSYTGRGVVLADSTRITTTTAAGSVSLLAPISAIVGGAELEITTLSSGAEVSLGRVGSGIVSGDQGPSALKVTTTGSGKFNLDNDVFVSPPFAATTAVKLVGNVEVGADVRVATGAGAFGAGPIDLSAARLYASTLGRALIFDSTNAAGSADVALGIVDSGPTGGAYLTQLDVLTGGGSNSGGDLLLTRDVLLDSSATRTARLSFVGDDLVVASANVTIDTEQGGDHAGGDVLLSSTSIAAAAIDSQLTIDSRGNGTGGDIQFGAVDNAAGTRQFLGSFTARTQTGGTIDVQGDIRTDATAAITGGVTLVGDVRLNLASGSTWTVGTQQDNAGNGADIDLGGANLFAVSSGVDVTLSASGYGPGGSGANPAAVGGTITLGNFNPTGGTTLIDDLLFESDGAARGDAIAARTITVAGGIRGQTLNDVRLADTVELQAGTGDVAVYDRVGQITLAGGATGRNRLASTLGSVLLADVVTAGTVNELRVEAGRDVALSSVTLPTSGARLMVTADRDNTDSGEIRSLSPATELVSASILNLQAANGIAGSQATASPLRIRTSSLAAYNSTSGAILIDNVSPTSGGLFSVDNAINAGRVVSIAQSGPTSSALQVNGIISGAQVSLAATGAIAGTPIGQIIAPVVTLNAGGGIGRSTSNPLQLAAQDITALSSGNSVTVASTTYSPGVFLSNVSSSPVTARQIASAPLGTTITSSTADISFVQTGGGQLRIGDASATGAARQAMIAGRNVSVSNNMAGIEIAGIVEAGRRIPGGPPLGTTVPPAAVGQIALTTTTATSDIVLASTAVLITHDPNAGAGDGIVVSAGDDLTIQSGAKLIVGEASTGGPAGVIGQAPPVATVTPQVLSNGGNIAQNGDVALPITIGNATDPFQETNFTVTINWGDAPTPQVDTLTGLDSIGGGGAGFAPPSHRYTAQNPRNTDTIFGSVTVSIDPRIVLTAKTATSAVDLGSTTTTFQLKPPPGGIVSAAVFVARAENVATVVPVRATVVNAVIPFQLTTSTPPTAMRRIEPERIEVSERKLLLMVVNPLTGDEVNVDTFTNLDSVLNDLPSLFARLLDDRYRLYLEGEDGSRQLVKEFLIRDGKEVELEDTSDASDGSSGDPMLEMTDDGTAENSPARGDQRRRRVGPTLAPVRPGAAASEASGESDIVPRVVVPARPGATPRPAPTRVVPPSAIQPNAAPPGLEQPSAAPPVDGVPPLRGPDRSAKPLDNAALDYLIGAVQHGSGGGGARGGATGESGAAGANGAAVVKESSADVGTSEDGGLAQWGAAAAVGATAGLAGVAAVLSRTKSRAWGEQVTEALTEREPSAWDRLKRIVRQAKQS